MTAAERLLATARAEIGYHEKASNRVLDSKTGNAGDRNYTKYARDLDALGDVYNGGKNGYDWCDVFVDWCFITTFGKELGMKLLCQPYRGCGAGTRYSMGYYQARGQFHRTRPQPGDQIFFGTSKSVNHTGIVERVGGGTVYTIEGNTGGGVQVARKFYGLNGKTILGYGRPDWSLVKEESAKQPAQQQKGDDDTLTYEQFREYMEKYRAELQAKEGSGWSREARDWAVERGLFQGAGGESDYLWQDFLTREQAAALFQRFDRTLEGA